MLHGIDKIASLKSLGWFIGIYLKVSKISFVTDHMRIVLNKDLDSAVLEFFLIAVFPCRV